MALTSPEPGDSAALDRGQAAHCDIGGARQDLPDVIVSVVVFKGLVPKLAVPPSTSTLGIVPAEPEKVELKLRVPELEVNDAPIELTVPIRLVVPPLELSIVAPVTS